MAAEPFVALVASLANGRITFHYHVFAEHFPHLFQEGVGVLAVADVVGMCAFDHGIFGEANVVAADEEEALHALVEQLAVGFAQHGVAVAITAGDVRTEDAIGRTAAFNQYDGGFTFFAQLVDAFGHALDDFLAHGVAIGHGVEYEGAGVDFRHGVEEGRFHQCGA